jgi:hypothetical protein
MLLTMNCYALRKSLQIFVFEHSTIPNANPFCFPEKNGYKRIHGFLHMAFYTWLFTHGFLHMAFLHMAFYTRLFTHGFLQAIPIASLLRSDLIT